MSILKKSVYAAMGLAVMTKDKVEKAAKKISKDAEMSEEEGRKFVDELVSKSEEARKNIDRYISKQVSAALKKLNVPTHEDFESLDLRLANLENGQALEAQ